MIVTALLPFKLNSSRVPNKNFKKLYHKPLFEWTLETLLSLKAVNKIVINTDAVNKIKRYSIFKNPKILIRPRPLNLCGDEVSMNKVIANDISNYSSDIYLMTHTTNPFLKKKTLNAAISLFKRNFIKKKYDSFFSVNKFQSRFYNGKSLPINHDPNNLIPTQQLTPWFEENSIFYLFTKNSFNKTNARIGKKPMLFETDRIESIDIDNLDDWYLAELIAAGMYNK